MRFRFLPVFILIAALGAGVKFAGLWQTFSASAPAFAAGDLPPPQETAAGDPAMADDAADSAAGARPIPEEQISNISTDIFQMTDEELVLLQSLSQRREELEQRAREIDEREVLLKAAEQRIEQRIGELEDLQASIEALLVEHDEQTEAQMQSLVKIYESMKPKEAARIFEELDMEVLLEVVERMKERKSAPILAKMNPERAKTVTLELAQRRELPLPRE
ncbi:MotE family protein [Pelagibius marinus]|uniref:MotE family protein n=1 Tax=Pelagibius marinus TaxID=2762760 RepID=UPI00187288EF|nr:MotE family protein [Pelagibius marinus]